MNEITEQFLIFIRLFRRYTSYHHKSLGKYGNFLQGQGRILAVLKMRPDISQKDLTYLLAIRPQSLGELLVKLERNELIERHPAQEDRRIMMIHLTAKGKKVAEKMDEAHNIALFNKLTKEEQVQFSQLLGKLSNAMQEELPESDKNERFYEDPQKHFEMFKQFQKAHGDLPVKFFETETKNKCCQKHK
ncbi:MarR family winged helix-turn-helix transcriptional regulator [Ligilactobacillus acidipiscis]|uniref:MarR family winged helix-turn-helix transcriptional regulator n=1 Tax=Ligilactobacillus acidipiscis TaxID=89059 RepID=UPI0023F89022|nr:MarR family transcriptional regulator [Ligilactobacillus acidipiscis]WEV57285.1 MarR family transcriptional regulator [Ligilactobacillus acidipiscis]